MAVTTTPEDLIEAGYAKSTKNNPGAIATDAVELLNLVNRIVRKCYILAARINPGYFGVITQVAAPGAGNPWPRPEGAESVFYMESGGAEVIVVPPDARDTEPSKPAVYRVGKNYYAAGNAGDPDPTSDAMDFWYSKRPTDAASLTTALDSTWEEQFNEIIILEIAIYLAEKDARTEEVASLSASRDQWMQLFVLFLEHETANERRRYKHVKRFHAETLFPIATLIGAGS